jgi:hypothetical protein
MSLSMSSCTEVSALVAIWKISPPTPLGGRREPQRPDEVVHVDVVAGLGTVAVYLQWLGLHRPRDEARDGVADLVDGTGPIDVAETEGDGPYAEGLIVRGAVALPG